MKEVSFRKQLFDSGLLLELSGSEERKRTAKTTNPTISNII